MDGYFILHGVKKSSIHPVTTPLKIAQKKDRKAHKLNVSTTSDGYSFVIANTFCVDFETDKESEKICWWDHHECDEFMRLPYKHRVEIRQGKRIHVFTGPGIFCDIFCMCAYIQREGQKIASLRDPHYEELVSNMKFLFSITYEPTAILKPAPDWRTLRRYGGSKTIEQFRKGSYNKVSNKLPKIEFAPAAMQFLE
jgi:hypothetical protein